MHFTEPVENYSGILINNIYLKYYILIGTSIGSLIFQKFIQLGAFRRMYILKFTLISRFNNYSYKLYASPALASYPFGLEIHVYKCVLKIFVNHYNPTLLADLFQYMDGSKNLLI